MRKATLTAVFSILLFMLSLALSVRTWAQPTEIPHEDPDRAEDVFQAHGLLSSYSILLEFIAYGRFDDSDSMVELLGAVDVPDEIQSAIDAYYSLTRELSESLNGINTLLKQAEDLINNSLFAEAEAVLAEIKMDLDQLDGQINDMIAGIENLSEQIGDFVTNIPLFDSARDLHQEMFALLRESNDFYQELYLQLNEVAESVGLPTALTIILSPDTVYVGEQITLEGTLKYKDGDDRVALPGREIILRMGQSASVLKVLTDANGYYTGVLDMPYNYTASVTAKASFNPTTDYDEDHYRSSHVESEVSIGFYHTGLDLASAPMRVLTGYPFTVGGVVTGDEVQVAGREIQFHLNGEQIGTGFSETGGSFELDVTVPAGLPLGNYQLIVSVLPDNDSQSSGASKHANINVSEDIPNVVLNSPSHIFAPSSVRFDGNVSYNGAPVTNAAVSMMFAGKGYSTETDGEGYFEIVFELPLSLSVVSGNTALVHVQPEEGWLGLVEIKSDFTVLSPLSIGFFSLAVIASGVVAFSLTKKRRRQSLIRREELFDDADFLPPRKYAVERDGVLAAYDKALAVMQEFTGVIAGFNMTLRDYVNELDPKFEKMKQLFEAITFLAEISLYSANPGSSDVEEANRLLSELTGELISESA
ncbi:hypothetical protein ACFLVP_02155 [Chloroflexota bacterium]